MANRSGGNPTPDALAKFLSLGDPDGVWVPDEADDKTRSAADQVAHENARRSYDAPAKGVLWGWQVTAYLWTKAISAGAIVVAMSRLALYGDVPLLTQWAAIAISIIFLGLTGWLLTLDLDQPKRFLYVLFRPQWRSWLVRGAYIISAFGAAMALWVLLRLFGSSSGWLAGPLVLLATLTAIYTAFLFAQAKGRDFWQNPVLPIHMFAHSVMAGAAVFCLLFPGETVWGNWLRMILMMSIGLKVSCDLFEMFTKHPTRDAQTTAHMIFRGRYAIWYWPVVFAAGSILPFLIAWLSIAWLLPLAGILILVGIYVAEHIWVRAPQQIPLS